MRLCLKGFPREKMGQLSNILSLREAWVYRPTFWAMSYVTTKGRWLSSRPIIKLKRPDLV